MIMTAIVFMAAILVDFTYETQINKIKVVNVQDKEQAKFNAESGLQMALARLTLYKEAKNYLAKNKDAAKNVSGETINQLYSIPFVYPIPVSESLNTIQKDTINEFMENNVIQGSINVMISNVSHLINLNLLRIGQLDKKPDDNSGSRGDLEDEESTPKTAVQELEKQLTELIRNAIEQKSEGDEEFAARFSSLRPEYLVKIIKFYVSDKDSYEEPEEGQISSSFGEMEIEPKHAPLSSLSELHLLPFWDDAIIELIKNEITVHGQIVIDVNKMTDKMLALLFPTLSEEQRKEFFEFKQDPEDPTKTNYFENVDDFRRFFVTTTNLISPSDYDNRVKEFKKAGIQLGTSANLFRVTSSGEFNRAKSTITAYVDMPPKPFPSPTPTATPTPLPLDATPAPVATPTPTPVPPTEYLDPRVVEILVN